MIAGNRAELSLIRVTVSIEKRAVQGRRTMTDLDYYQVLQVEPSATANEIREAYYDHIQRRYEQRGKDIETAVHIQQVSEAYTILGNPYRRASYDLERLQDAASASEGKAAQLSAQSASFLSRIKLSSRTQWYLMAGILMLGVAVVLSALLQGIYWLPVLMIVMLCVLMNLLAILMTRRDREGDISNVNEEKKRQVQA
jgi:Flp pilus assembly protein TadB